MVQDDYLVAREQTLSFLNGIHQMVVLTSVSGYQCEIASTKSTV